MVRVIQLIHDFGRAENLKQFLEMGVETGNKKNEVGARGPSMASNELFVRTF